MDINIPAVLPGLSMADVRALISSYKKGLRLHVEAMRETSRYRASINAQFLEGHERLFEEFLGGLRRLLSEAVRSPAQTSHPAPDNGRLEKLERALEALTGKGRLTPPDLNLFLPLRPMRLQPSSPPGSVLQCPNKQLPRGSRLRRSRRLLRSRLLLPPLPSLPSLKSPPLNL
ncbi:hypothetical protein RUM43_006723 [Polyplax serrata]|uniref:Uncharacterized protein n=1 Tax=Polyplax serrata TaxID=468196 RepID=A0AAN8S5M7_POLSC